MQKMSKKLAPIRNVSKSQSLSGSNQGGDGKQTSSLNQAGVVDKKFSASDIKDYEGLLTYCMKLIDDNKQLLTENSGLQTENEESMTMNIQLLEENQKLKNEKDKLVDDSLSMIEYNEQLIQEKETLDSRCSELKEGFDTAVSLLTPEAKATLVQKNPKFFSDETSK